MTLKDEIATRDRVVIRNPKTGATYKGVAENDVYVGGLAYLTVSLDEESPEGFESVQVNTNMWDVAIDRPKIPGDAAYITWRCSGLNGARVAAYRDGHPANNVWVALSVAGAHRKSLSDLLEFIGDDTVTVLEEKK